ncbi:MAG: hypothetical protein JWL63_1099 [Rhodocyclales bacterium]|nr:hypothetical protein [Rhodocyclales bacterium]
MRVVTFPGLGAAYPQMLEKYLAAYPEDSALVQGWRARTELVEGSAEFMAELHAQAEIHALNLLWWRREGAALKVDAVCGHSLGYYAALVAAGVINEETSFGLLIAVLHTLWPAFTDNTQHIHVLTTRHATNLAALAERHDMELIAENNSMQGVLYGSTAAWDSLTSDMGDDMLRGVSLPTRVPFHSEAVKPLAKALHSAVQAVTDEPGACSLPLWSHIDAAPVADGEQALALVASQPYRAVRWAQLVKTVCERGVKEFIEVGPNRVLTQIARLSVPHVEARFVDHLRRQG